MRFQFALADKLHQASKLAPGAHVEPFNADVAQIGHMQTEHGLTPGDDSDDLAVLARRVPPAPWKLRELGVKTTRGGHPHVQRSID